MSRKTKRWWPGIYEGKTPAQVLAQIGTAQYESTFHNQHSTPHSMRGLSDTRVAYRRDGTVCRSINGIPQ